MTLLEDIQKLIDSDVAPILALHNGSARAIAFYNGTLELQLEGGCVGCPSSKITIFNGVLPILKDKFSDIKDVILV